MRRNKATSNVIRLTRGRATRGRKSGGLSLLEIYFASQENLKNFDKYKDYHNFHLWNFNWITFLVRAAQNWSWDDSIFQSFLEGPPLPPPNPIWSQGNPPKSPSTLKESYESHMVISRSVPLFKCPPAHYKKFLLPFMEAHSRFVY